jgi:hypothetical protein
LVEQLADSRGNYCCRAEPDDNRADAEGGAANRGIDRRIALVARDGRETCGEIVADSYVGPHVTTIAWRPDGAWRVRSLLVFSDTFGGDDFRRLRVVLRYGLVPGRGDGSSDEEAG